MLRIIFQDQKARKLLAAKWSVQKQLANVPDSRIGETHSTLVETSKLKSHSLLQNPNNSVGVRTR